MRVCQKCFTSNGDESKYCEECGNPLSQKEAIKEKFWNKYNIVFVVIIIICLIGFYSINMGNKNKIFSPKFENITELSPDTRLVSVRGKYGVIDRDLNYIIKPEYEKMARCSKNLFIAKKNQEIFFVDMRGNVFEFKYRNVTKFSEGLMRVSLESESGYSTYYVDTKGNVVMGIYKGGYSGDFHNGMAEIKNSESEKEGFMDRNGNITIEPKFDRVYDFSDGLALVEMDKKYGFINTKGEYVIESKFHDASSFSEGLAVARIDGKYGFINTKGEYVIEPKFHDAFNFSDGLALVRINDKYGFINIKGEYVIEPKFHDVSSFREGLAGVIIIDKYGFINKEGKVVINARFDYNKSSYFKEGLAKVRYLGDNGFVDKNGDFVIEPKFYEVYDFNNGLAIVAVKRKYADKKYGIIDKKGNYVVEPKFDNIRNVGEGFVALKFGNKWGVIKVSDI